MTRHRKLSNLSSNSFKVTSLYKGYIQLQLPGIVHYCYTVWSQVSWPIQYAIIEKDNLSAILDKSGLLPNATIHSWKVHPPFPACTSLRLKSVCMCVNYASIRAFFTLTLGKVINHSQWLFASCCKSNNRIRYARGALPTSNSLLPVQEGKNVSCWILNEVCLLNDDITYSSSSYSRVAATQPSDMTLNILQIRSIIRGLTLFSHDNNSDRTSEFHSY